MMFGWVLKKGVATLLPLVGHVRPRCFSLRYFPPSCRPLEFPPSQRGYDGQRTEDFPSRIGRRRRRRRRRWRQRRRSCCWAASEPMRPPPLLLFAAAVRRM